MAKYSKAKTDAAKAAADQIEAEGILKPFANGEWMKEYEKSKRAPESFIIGSDKDSALYVVQDSYKYAGLDDERVAYLRGEFGDEIVKTEKKFVLNAEMVEKYGQAISNAIVGSKEIPDDEKGLIIQCETQNRIVKGAIGRLAEFAKNAKCTIERVFSEIMPTQQLKPRGK